MFVFSGDTYWEASNAHQSSIYKQGLILLKIAPKLILSHIYH